MRAPDSLPGGFLWFPQVKEPEERRTPSDLNVPRNTLAAFCSLFSIVPFPSVEPTTYSTQSELFNLHFMLEQVLRLERPIYVFGSFSSDDAVNHSWDKLGLNLFDLPWFSPKKAFQYVSLRTLPGQLKALHDFVKQEKKPDELGIAARRACQEAREHLQWAWCHQFARAMQQAVGHGKRGTFQTASWNAICSDVRKVLNRFATVDFLCSGCEEIRQRAQYLLRLRDDGDDRKRLALVQEVAALDCRAHRLAQAKYFHPVPRLERPQFQRIIILEDDKRFYEKLEEALQAYLAPEGRILKAHPKESLKRYRLCDEQGEDLIRQCHDEEIESGAILACFDLDLGEDRSPESEMRRFVRGIFGGHWIMYGTASAYSDVPRMTVTGFRSQDFLSLAAGSGAYLLKPFDEVSLEKQVTAATILKRVKWLCPAVVQEDYHKLLGVPFRKYADFLYYWLGQRRIELEVIDKPEREHLLDGDTIVVDLLTMDGEAVRDLWDNIVTIRNINKRAPLLVILPAGAESSEAVVDYYRKAPQAIRDGYDAILKKPFWAVAEGSPAPREVFGEMILRQLALAGDFDIKYQILVPVAAVIGRLDGMYFFRLARQRNKDKAKENNEAEPTAECCTDEHVKAGIGVDLVFAPLIPALVDSYGFSASLATLKDLDPEKLKCALLKWIEKQKILDPERWVSDPDNPDPATWTQFKETSITPVISRFASQIKNDSIQHHLTVENWLRKVVDEMASRTFPSITIHSLTEPLAKVFGGSTRYEFTVQGSWYKSADQRIDDLLIVVEFCARSSITARLFIEKTVVQYLRTVAGEETVLVQEIPIRGYLK